jgi:hypothetical protein
MSTTETKTRTVTLTGRAPVKIREDEWPVIAEASGDSFRGDVGRYRQAQGQGEIDTYTIKVRQHADGRSLVYGILDAAIAAWRQPAGGEDWRGGELLDSGADLATAIARVCSGHLPDSVIRDAIADLPAQEL